MQAYIFQSKRASGDGDRTPDTMEAKTDPHSSHAASPECPTAESTPEVEHSALGFSHAQAVLLNFAEGPQQTENSVVTGSEDLDAPQDAGSPEAHAPVEAPTRTMGYVGAMEARDFETGVGSEPQGVATGAQGPSTPPPRGSVEVAERAASAAAASMESSPVVTQFNRATSKSGNRKKGGSAKKKKRSKR
jgi:hypothetical protein